MAELENRSSQGQGSPDENARQTSPAPQENIQAVVTSEDEEPATTVGFPVVALGASAGGLEAFKLVLQNLPADTGMGFVLIQHLAPQHASQLTSLLSQATSMPVTEVKHGVAVSPNHIFVIPPNTIMSISRGVLELAPRLEGTGVPMPINHFFRSLAQDQKSGAIGVVLSGADSDGALGLQAIREAGGIAIAQSEGSAKFPGMPHNAAGAGPVDLILPPEEIARELGSIGGKLRRNLPLSLSTETDGAEPGTPSRSDQQHFNTILALLRKATGIDFRGYKPQTLSRRVARRMLLRRQENLAGYAADLKENTAEVRALYEDVLINVTSFFRDPDTFRAFGSEILPELLKRRASDAPLRVWVPGCSSGEEVYSIAICLIQSVSKLPAPVPIQLFGTDLSDRMLSLARSAVYQEHQLAELSEEYRQFFVPVPNGFQVVKPVREVCIFARQNVCTDPPFAKLDLISCRNLLIYLGSELQRQVVATFHYALKPEGVLMLGRSETLRGFPELFSAADKHHKFFRRTAGEHASLEMVGRGFAREQAAAKPSFNTAPKLRAGKVDLERLAERIIMREHSPPWVVVDESLKIIHSSGDTSPYLQLPVGAPSFDLLKMARESLRGELKDFLAEAKNNDVATQSSIVREVSGGTIQRIGLEVRRVPNDASEKFYFLVIFTLVADRSDGRQADIVHSVPQDRSHETELLREELALTDRRLQTIIDERDAANQELTSANEEIQSSNEELQSINEELETAKEELQSSNEELSTLNEELQNRNVELGRVSDDLSNLMSSTTIPILLLDGELRIRRMTPVAESSLGIRSSDVGRPVGDIRMRLSVEDVESLARDVLVTLTPREVELQDRENNWRQLRLRPYRTADNKIEGVVLVLVDIDQLRRAREQATQAREFAESVIEAIQMPLLVLRGDLRIRLANRAFYEDYGLPPAEVENQPWLEIGGSQFNLPGLRPALERVLDGREKTEEVEHELSGPAQKTVCVHLRLVQPDGEKLILVAIEDITAQKSAASILVAGQEELKSRVEEGTAALRETESALLRSRGELRELAASLLSAQEAERRRISRELHDDLSQKVARLQFDIETLEQKVPFSNLEDARQRLRNVRDQTGTLANDLRRVAHGLHPSSLDHLGLTVALRSYAEEFSRSTAIPVQFTSHHVPREISIEVSSCLYRIVQEALRNVGKHSPDAGVDIMLSGSSEALDLSIRDNGVGFNVTLVRERGGLGLISMQERVRLVQGQFLLQTRPGHGVHISIQIPLRPELG